MPSLKGKWEPCIAFIKWPHTMRQRYSRKRILKGLKAHQISDVRFIVMLQADSVLMLRRGGISYKDIAGLIERAILVEFNERVSVIVKPVALLRSLLNECERLIARMTSEG